MTKQQLFPSVMIILSACSAIANAQAKNWNLVIYWISAAILTASVTFKIG